MNRSMGQAAGSLKDLYVTLVRNSAKGLAGGLMLACLLLASAPLTIVQAADPKPDAKALEERAREARERLKKYEQQIRRARARQKGVEHNVSILDEENARLNKLLISTARRIQDDEAVLTRIELRLGELAAQEDLIRGSLAQRHGKIAKLLASMQRIGRQPPPVIVTQREDALKMVRSAMLLGSLYPQLKNSADELVAKLTELVRVTSNIRLERDRLKQQSSMLVANRSSIKKLMSEKKARLMARRNQLASLRNVVKLHAKSVTSLSELVAKLDKELKKKSQLGKYEKKLARGKAGGKTKTAFLNPSRIEPAVPFSKTRGILPMPVSGIRLRSYGQEDDYGNKSNGIVLETRSEAQVSAPSDGWVVYAGHFRRYGNLLIINAGGGYHILLAGMDKMYASVGQFVLAGEPIGFMSARGARKRRNVVKTAGNDQPSLYIEFRKDGRSINPDPWWSAGKLSGKNGSGKGKV
jgi:septal ring factor EnvC (AmiA/AmiB activator)